MIIRYGYYFERTSGLTAGDRLHVNVFAFSRDVKTGMVLFGHAFYKGDMVEFSEIKPRLRMTALNRLMKKPVVAFLPKGDILDNFCKDEKNQKRIQPHMSIDGSLVFESTETSYKHYRPYATVYLLMNILRSSVYKTSLPIVREMVVNQDEGLKVSNIKFRATQMWDIKSNKLVNIPRQDDGQFKDPYRSWQTDNFASVFNQSGIKFKTVDAMMENQYLNTQLYKGNSKVHFSEVKTFSQDELNAIGLFAKENRRESILAKNFVPKGVHMFHWKACDDITIFISFIPDIEKGSLVYNYFVSTPNFIENRSRDYRRLGNHISMRRMMKKPIYMVCDANNSIERRDAIKKRIYNYYLNGHSLDDGVGSSFKSFFLYPFDLLANWLIGLVHHS